MARTFTITVPDDEWDTVAASYIRDVANWVEEGHLSGHHAVDRHWESGKS